MSSLPAKVLKAAFCQISVGDDLHVNVENAIKSIRNAVKLKIGVKVVVLPETFNCPYGTEHFRNFSELVPTGYTCQQLSKISKELGIYLIAGSIIEVDYNDKLYNTVTIWNPKGELIGKHRKIHLFDISVTRNGGCVFKESSVLTPGEKPTIVTIEGRKFGIGICHDIRFDELAKIYALEGCQAIIYPSGFDVCQGEMYWKLLQQARAIDNSCFVGMVCAARDPKASYVDYGHSMLVNPWGDVVVEAGEAEEIVFADFGRFILLKHFQLFLHFQIFLLSMIIRENYLFGVNEEPICME